MLPQIFEDAQDTLPLLKAEAPNIMRRSFNIMKTTSLAQELLDDMRYTTFEFFSRIVLVPKFQRDRQL